MGWPKVVTEVGGEEKESGNSIQSLPTPGPAGLSQTIAKCVHCTKAPGPRWEWELKRSSHSTHQGCPHVGRALYAGGRGAFSLYT